MELVDKFVDFEKYCGSCIFRTRDESEDPCDECLSHPTNEHSHKPVYYEKSANMGKGGKKRESR